MVVMVPALSCDECAREAREAPAWLTRLREEESQLAERTVKLETFLAAPPVNLLAVDRSLLVRQLVLMRDLREVLRTRITRATTP
jgi:hypothetical protein